MEQQYQDYPRPPQKSNNLLPLAIIVAGVLVAAAIFITKKDSGSTQPATQSVDVTVVPVTQADHILGSPNAPVIMVEYSDTDCPYCQQFHPNLQKLVDAYGKDGKLAWVYRHFAFHERAPKEAEATECVAEIGGNAKFWEFTGKLFAAKHFQTSQTDTYKGVDPKDLPDFAAGLGIDKAGFTTCLNSGKYAQKVKNQYNDAIAAGAVGTPHTIVISAKPINAVTKEFIDSTNLTLLARQGPGGSAPFTLSSDKKNVIVSGAMPFAIMDQLVKLMLQGNS